MKLIIGLGNPGLAYARSRHNSGFMVIRKMGRIHDIRLDKKQCLARTGTGRVAGEPVLLARPQTYMNSSGLSAKRLLSKFNAQPGDLIIVHDDIDLPLGKIRLRQGGGSGGHRGVQSIIDEFETDDFIRLRIGIGRPNGDSEADYDKIIDYVLSDFSLDEKKVVNDAIARACQAIECLLGKGITQAMNIFN